MEVRTAVDNRLSVFRHAAIKFLDRRVVNEMYGIKVARTDATSAAYALGVVYRHLLAFGVEYESVVGAFAHTAAATAACVLVNVRFAVAVLVFLSRP